MSWLLGTAAPIASADSTDSKDREWIAELNLDTGTESWRHELQTAMDGDGDEDEDEIGPRLSSMNEVDYIHAGFFVILSSGGERKCAQGLQRVCPEPGKHWLYVKEKRTVRERIEQARQLVGTQNFGAKKFSTLRYNSSLYVYETATSKVLWEHHWKKDEELLLTTDNERIYAATKDGVTAYEIHSARVLWSQHAFSLKRHKLIGQHEGKLLVQSGPSLMALNLATGTLLWKYDAGPSGDPWPQMVRGKAYVMFREAQPIRWVCGVP